MERAKTSGRSDDTEEVIRKRLSVFAEESRPVVDLYRQFGRVREVDGMRDVSQVWQDTRKAMLPQVSFVIGPKGSGKSALGAALAKRTNMSLLCFDEFVTHHGLQNEEEETVVLALIKHLSMEVMPRVLIEDFPQTAFQAKFFIRNCVQPKDVFMLNCSKDIS